MNQNHLVTIAISECDLTDIGNKDYTTYDLSNFQPIVADCLDLFHYMKNVNVKYDLEYSKSEPHNKP